MIEIFNVLYRGVEKNVTPFCLAFLKEEEAREWIESTCEVKSYSIKSTFGWNENMTMDDYRVEDVDGNSYYFVIYRQQLNKNMKTEKKLCALVNQLTKKDQELAYKNHLEQFHQRSVKPETKEEFLNLRVVQCFKFNHSFEGGIYWIEALDKILDTERESLFKIQRKENYLKEKKQLAKKKELIVFVFFVSIMVCVFLFFLLLFIFNK